MTQRLNFYQDIHKGIRAMLAHVVETAGRTSFTDAASVARLRAVVDDVFELLAGHAVTEDTYVHPLVRAGSAAVAERLEAAHADQEHELERLSGMLAAAEHGGADAPANGQAFVLALTRYVSEQMLHMADEEELAQAAIWAGHDDATLREAHGRLLASIPPQKMMRYLRYMLPALNAEERAGMLLGMRAAAPPPAFAATVALCKEVLAPDQWQRLPADVVAAA